MPAFKETPLTWGTVKKMFGDGHDNLPVYSVKIVHLDGKFETVNAPESGKTMPLPKWRKWARDWYEGKKV